MGINANNFRDDLSANFIKLLDSKRGVASNLAKSIGKPPSFINEIKRGNPVNALHLKAVSIVFGTKVLLDLMGINDFITDRVSNFDDQFRGKDVVNRLLELEKMSPKVFDMVATYITGAHEAAKATAQQWEEIEKGGKQKEQEGFEIRKQGTNE
jgi:hypothetical protein